MLIYGTTKNPALDTGLPEGVPLKQQRPFQRYSTKEPTHTASKPGDSSLGNQAMLERMKTNHIVQKNDTLQQIAESTLDDANRYMEIATLNGLSDPNVIFTGQVLQIPNTNGQPSDQVVTSPVKSITELPVRDKEKTSQFLDPLLASLRRQDSKRGNDFFSKIIQTEVSSSKETEPQRDFLMDAVQQYAKENPKRDGESWAGWCASLMFRFGKSTSGFQDGVNDAPSAISAATQSNIQSIDESKAPKGAFHWWDIGKYGHVGLDVTGGGTQVFMATHKLKEFFGPKADAIGLTSIKDYNQAISGTYMGWSMDYVGGRVQEELLNEAPSSKSS
jgi:LysM repeat protein